MVTQGYCWIAGNRRPVSRFADGVKTNYRFMTNDVDSTGKYNGIVAAFNPIGKIWIAGYAPKAEVDQRERLFPGNKESLLYWCWIKQHRDRSLKIPAEPITVKYDIKISPATTIFSISTHCLPKRIRKIRLKQLNVCTRLKCLIVLMDPILTWKFPKGYVIDELPKSARVKLNEDEGMFEYIIAVSAIEFNCGAALFIKKANFEPGDYQTLRDFFCLRCKNRLNRSYLKSNSSCVRLQYAWYRQLCDSARLIRHHISIPGLAFCKQRSPEGLRAISKQIELLYLVFRPMFCGTKECDATKLHCFLQVPGT